MGKYSKLREKILAGGADSNIEFAELCTLLSRLRFCIEKIYVFYVDLFNTSERRER